eukprot:Em0014g281a
MKLSIRVVLLVATSACIDIAPASALKIGAFNVQVFGPTKFSDSTVVATLSKIVRRYDVVLIQEIRDAAQTVIYSFVGIVNIDSAASGVTYNVTVSPRLGRTSSKEQYAFIYRTDRFTVLNTHLYDDSAADIFEREPYSVLLRDKQQGVGDFFLLGIHVKPDDAFNEINNLPLAYDAAKVALGTDRALLLGDFNAGCSYLTDSQYKAVALVTDKRFTWLISSSTDTTTGTSVCAYDRIVSSQGLLSDVVTSTAGVYLFDKAYGLTSVQTQAVSDHYPVEVNVGGSVAASSEQFVAFSSSVTEVGVALVLSLVAIFGRLVVCFL